MTSTRKSVLPGLPRPTDMPLEKLLLIRHGELPDPVRKKLIRHLDPPLAESGREQILKLKPYLTGISVDALYVSPLLRTRETAELLFPGQKQWIDDRLIEYDFGECEGMTPPEVIEKYPQVFQFWKDQLKYRNIPYPGGESFNDVAARTGEFLAELRKKEEKTVAVVSHGGPLFHLLRNALLPDWLFMPDRGSVSIVNFYSEDKPGVLKLYNFRPESFSV